MTHGGSPRADFAECREIAEQVAGLGAWSHDLRHQQLHWSPGACRIFGIAADAPPPGPAEFDAALTEADRARWHDALHAAVHDGRQIKIAFRYRQPAGDTVWVRIALRPRF